ncbi:MAG: hypothetical protein ACK5NT_11590 [Pyrinomonadaceae bacterium]
MKKFLIKMSIAALVTCAGSLCASAQSGDDTQKGDGGSKIIQIGVLMPTVSLKKATGDIPPEEALRNSYAALLNSDSVQVVPLDARLTSLALEEARNKKIDYILNLNLTQEQKKSGGGIFGRVIRDVGESATWETAGQVPGSRTAGGTVARTAARSAIINTGYTLSNVTIEIKKNDKFTLAYNLTSIDGKSVLEDSIEVKAKKSNDDKLLTDMVTQSAEAIAKAVIRQ